MEGIRDILNKKLQKLYPRMIKNAYNNIQQGYYEDRAGRYDLADEIVQTVSLDLLERCNDEPVSFGKGIDSNKMDNYILSAVRWTAYRQNSKVLYAIGKDRKSISFKDAEYMDNTIDNAFNDGGINYRANWFYNLLTDFSNPLRLDPIEKITISKIFIDGKTIKQISEETDTKQSTLYSWRKSAIGKMKAYFANEENYVETYTI